MMVRRGFRLFGFLSFPSLVLMTVPAGPGLAASGIAASSDNPFASEMPYAACLAAVDEMPEEALENALIWRDGAGGGQAEHCAALALLALGFSGEAAIRLEALARRSDSGPPHERAELLSQSGNAWLRDRQADLAAAVFSAALKLAPRDAHIWTDRARAHAMNGDWEEAESDLNAALAFEKGDPEIFVLRSAARRSQGKQAQAVVDIDAALALDPDNPDGLAERGMMRFLDGDKAGARADWIKVLNAAPESVAADAARAGIERMEIRIEP